MRCKCCDEIMHEDEIIWYEELKVHDDMCFACKKKALYPDDYDDELPNIADWSWDNE